MDAKLAGLVYDVLVRHCAASEHQDSRADFIARMSEPDVREYRFQGGLGFGGKFRRDAPGWRVTCYSEDETERRLAMMRITNWELDCLERTVANTR